MGIHFVRLAHYGMRDAQAIWKDLTSYMLTSTRADTFIKDLSGCMTPMRLTIALKRTIQQSP